jgi:uncharacterized SAM-binding protein YcdF (DUF218 family)
MRRRNLWLIAIATMAALVFALVTLTTFVRPTTGHISSPDAIVLIDDGIGVRLKTAIRLAEEGKAPNLVISHRPDRPQDCVSGIANVTIYCFSPEPDSTQGEARKIGALAAEHGWKSLVFVTDPPHVYRARFRLSRCTKAKLAAVTTRVPGGLRTWVWRVEHEWLGSAQAVLVNRGC